MPWKKSVFDELSRMDTAHSGDGLHYLPPKVNTNGNPLLLIGLGGTGLRIVKETAVQMTRYFEPSPVPFPRTNEMLPAKTRILAIDTDESDLYHLDYMGDERCFIGCHDIANILTREGRQKLPDYILDWLDPELILHAPHTLCGAQAIRQLGRLSFFSHIADAADALRIALQQLETKNGYIYVVIAAGSAGGTGSALFLDTAFLVRHIAGMLGVRVYIAGLLTLPDIHCRLSPEAAPVLNANGYACLKELDYWMSSADDQPYQQRYSPMLAISVSDRPFDDCYLVSEPDSFFDQHYLDHLYRAAAECILNLHCFVPRAGMSGYLSWRANIRASLQHAQLPADACSRYTAVGVCSAQLPLDELITAEGAVLFREAGKARDAANACSLPDEKEYVSFVQQIMDGCADKLLDPIPDPAACFPTVQELRSSSACAPHDPRIDRAVAEYYMEMRKRTEGPEAREAIDRCVRQLSGQLTAMFADPAKGPFYTSRFLRCADGPERCLTGVLEKLRSAAHAQCARAMQEHQSAEKKAQDDYLNLKTSLFAALLGRTAFNRYADNCRAAHRALLEYHRQDFLGRLLNALLAKAEELYSQVIQPLCFALTELIKAFGEMKRPRIPADLSPLCIHAADLELIIQRFKDTQTSPQQISRLLETLYTDMIRPCDGVIAGQWLVRNALGTTERFGRFREHLERILSDFFRPFNSQTLTDFWKLQYPNAIQPDGSLKLSDVFSEQLIKMQNVAQPLFIQNTIFPFCYHSAVFCSKFVAVPPHMAGHGSVGNQPVSATDLPERLFMLNAADGVSLYQYGKLQQCEQDHLHAAVYGSLRGCHLWENRVNRKTLPNPMPRGVRPQGYQNPVQQAADEAFIARIDALRKDGWIRFDTFANTISLYSNPQYTREFAQVLLDKINAGTISDEMVQDSFEDVLRSRSVTVLTLQQSALDYYSSLEWVQDPFRSLAEDMLMRRPAKIAALEKDAEELAELVRAVRKCSQKADETKQLLQMAPRLADLFAFGILTCPTPLLAACTMDGAPPQTVYNSLRDNSKYAARFHPSYAREVCIAAKLVDMEDASHEEHDMLVQLKKLEDALANDLEGAVMELLTIRLTAFGANAQALKTKLAAARSAMLPASPEALKMTADDRQLCLDFLDGMISALDARAMGFGMTLH